MLDIVAAYILNDEVMHLTTAIQLCIPQHPRVCTRQWGNTCNKQQHSKLKHSYKPFARA